MNWAEQQLKAHSDQALVDVGVDLVGSRLIDATTNVHNYVIFSTFNTKEFHHSIKAVGILHQFFLMNKTS